MRKFRRVKTFLIVLLFAAVSMLLNSCYPDYGLSIQDFDVVSTIKDNAQNFQVYRTYFLPDSVEKVLGDGRVVKNDGDYDQDILSEIVRQMEAYGYTRVATKEESDVNLHVGTSTSSTFVYYPGYWGGYYGWYYPWYGYGGGYAYNYTTGSLFITMLDTDKFDEGSKVLGAVWAGAMNGVLDNSTSVNIRTRIIQGIDKMFDQSPYLKIIL